jgi:hypothetical protein
MLPVAYLLHLCPTSYFSPSYYESMKELIHWLGQSPQDPITSQKPISCQYEPVENISYSNYNWWPPFPWLLQQSAPVTKPWHISWSHFLCTIPCVSSWTHPTAQSMQCGKEQFFSPGTTLRWAGINVPRAGVPGNSEP